MLSCELNVIILEKNLEIIVDCSFKTTNGLVLGRNLQTVWFKPYPSGFLAPSSEAVSTGTDRGRILE